MGLWSKLRSRMMRHNPPVAGSSRKLKSMPSPRSLTLAPFCQQGQGVHLPIDTATLELLAAWRAGDSTTDPEKLHEADEVAEFKKAMNEHRAVTDTRLLFPSNHTARIVGSRLLRMSHRIDQRRPRRNRLQRIRSGDSDRARGS